MKYTATPGRDIYGAPVGIIIMDCMIPFPPGTPGNPSSFSFPVLYDVIKGADMARVIYEPDESLATQFIAAGERLVVQGVRAIFGNCGFMILFQEAMAEALPVPVLMSSLLQLSLIHSSLRPDQTIGIITADAGSLTQRHLEIACGGLNIKTSVAGMDAKPAFSAAIHEQCGQLDTETVEAEVVETARELLAANPSIGAFLFECTDLPPYACAVQQATGLPVFDAWTLINFGFSGIARTRFTGLY